MKVVCICVVLVLLGAMKLRAIIHLEQAYYLDRPLYILPAAEELRATKRAGDRPVMMARRPHLAFLAGMRFRRYPGEVASYEDLLKAAQDAGVDYLVYGRGEFVEFPSLRFLAMCDSVPGLEIAYAGEAIVVFKVPADLDIEAAVQKGEVLRLRLVIKEAVRSGDLCRDLANSILLGKRYLDGGQTEKAEQCLLAGLRRAGTEVHSYDVAGLACTVRYNLGVMWIQQARYDEARELLERTCAEPLAEGALQEIALSRYLLGYMDENLKRLEAALGHYEHARRDFLRAGDKAMAHQAAAHVDQLRQRLGRGEK